MPYRESTAGHTTGTGVRHVVRQLPLLGVRTRPVISALLCIATLLGVTTLPR